MRDLASENLVINLLTLAAIIGALGVLTRFTLSMRKVVRSSTRFFDDWTGEEARPGRPRRAGIPERLSVLEAGQAEIREQLKPNGGTSLRDAIDDVRRATTHPDANRPRPHEGDCHA